MAVVAGAKVPRLGVSHNLFWAMDEAPELLAKIQQQITECRRLAADVTDAKLALWLYRLADEVETEAREADSM